MPRTRAQNAASRHQVVSGLVRIGYRHSRKLCTGKQLTSHLCVENWIRMGCPSRGIPHVASTPRLKTTTVACYIGRVYTRARSHVYTRNLQHQI